jgi:hypothetical protein
VTNRIVLPTFALIALVPALGLAQSRADSVLEHGALAQAESMYYAAVRARPRDPVARRELGEYLVERGAPRVGMTLFEEAQRFGAEPRMVSRLLAPVYLSLGEYHSLAGLPSPPLSRSEHERARWLESHPTTIATPDSTVIGTYRETPGSESLGHITIRINGRPVDASRASRHAAYDASPRRGPRLTQDRRPFSASLIPLESVGSRSSTIRYRSSRSLIKSRR